MARRTRNRKLPLPIVRETGGLRDTVAPYNKYTGEGCGFSFRNANAQELEQCIHTALSLYRADKSAWTMLMRQAMGRDFGWSASAASYLALYRKLLK